MGFVFVNRKGDCRYLSVRDLFALFCVANNNSCRNVEAPGSNWEKTVPRDRMEVGTR
jgi:hypothetical protein